MAVAGIAGIFSAAGSVASIFGTMETYKGQQKAEELRKNQMKLEASRARREQVRKTQAATAKATAAAWNQGAGTSSALAGGVAQIRNQGQRNVIAINQDEKIGEGIFDANKQIARGQMMQSLGSGISSLGNAFASNAGTITRIGEEAKLPFAGNA
jgi:lysyl-tRNA synthetase class II